MVWQYYYSVHYQTREGVINSGRTVYYTLRARGVLIHYSFCQRLLTETGIAFNPKALDFCVGIVSNNDFQGCSPVRKARMVGRVQGCDQAGLE